jgi:class 3 adenylate cyclase
MDEKKKTGPQGPQGPQGPKFVMLGEEAETGPRGPRATDPTVFVPADVFFNFGLRSWPPTLATPHALGVQHGELSAKARELEKNIAELRQQYGEQARELKKEKAGAASRVKKIAELESTLDQFTEKMRLRFLLDRVNPDAQRALLNSESLRDQFIATKECTSFVMSVDIRRSTELMLKARRPDQFANFITTLCGDLETIITDAYGVFDKFTGDGVLAFFPDFFSGDDAGFRAVSAADLCHKAFNDRYREFRGSFISVLRDVGLGIGIDYGPVHLVQMANGLTVVGAPVVYACRMAGAPSGKTLLNQPAYEQISGRFSGYCFFTETALDLKHEGMTLSYEVSLNGNDYKPRVPNWCGDSTSGA